MQVACTSLAQSTGVSFTFLTGEVPPRQTRRGETLYPFDTLEVNQAFEVHHAGASSVRQAISRYYRNHGRGRLFVQRLNAAGRPVVWRTK